MAGSRLHGLLRNSSPECGSLEQKIILFLCLAGEMHN